MSLNFNSVIIAGNLTRDPQVRFLSNEKVVVDFGIAINRKFKSGGESREETTFVDVEAWGRTAELVGQYLTKGRGCLVQGRLKLDSWEDKETGQKRSKLKVVADSVQFTDSRTSGTDSEPVVIEDDAPLAEVVSTAKRQAVSRRTQDEEADPPPF